MMRMLKKLKRKKGLTLIEMVACLLTLTLIMLICTTGMNMAMKSYNQSLFESNSQMLESTLTTSIGDILRYAYNVTDSGSSVTFSNKAYGVIGGGLSVDSNGYLILTLTSGTDKMLIGKNVYAENLYIDDFDLSYTGDIFEGSFKIMSTIAADSERTVNFTFRSVAKGDT